MGVRDQVRRVKHAFHRSSKSSSNASTSSSSLSKSSTSSSTCPPPDPSIIYQPWEKMPTPKYRRPVAKEHADKLNAFDFATAWKRKSQVSLYSPMGSRLPSRRNSFNARRSFQETRVSALDESLNEDDDYVVVPSSSDLSTNATSHMPSRPHSRQQYHRNSSEQPFSAEDLTLALKRSHLDVPH